jgi:hypothetical protein
MLILICHSAPALSDKSNMGVYFTTAAAIPASSALFMVQLMLVPPGFTVMIQLRIFEGGRLQLQ